MATKFFYSVPFAGGGAPYSEKARLSLRMIRKGCANRPFFQISIQKFTEDQHGDVIEQIGVYDPMPNMFGEKLLGLNFNRLQYWLNKDVYISKPVQDILGLAGYFPIHPRSYFKAWQQRKRILEALESNTANEASKDGSE